jgi:hypothetical protein
VTSPGGSLAVCRSARAPRGSAPAQRRPSTGSPDRAAIGPDMDLSNLEVDCSL